MTREEALNEDIRILTREEAMDIVAEQLTESLQYDQDAIWDIVRSGFGGVDNMTNEELEDFSEFWGDLYILEWKLEAYNEKSA